MRKLAFISTNTIKQKRAATKNSIDEFQLPVCAPAKEQKWYKKANSPFFPFIVVKRIGGNHRFCFLTYRDKKV